MIIKHKVAQVVANTIDGTVLDTAISYSNRDELIKKIKEQLSMRSVNKMADVGITIMYNDTRTIETTSLSKLNGIVDKTNLENVTKSSGGLKYDDGKPLVGTMLNVFPNALMAIGKVIEFGTHKYPDPNNWKKVENASARYQDALMRHLLKHCMGIKIDEETGQPHLAHVAWNALAILELYLMKEKHSVIKSRKEGNNKCLNQKS